MINVLISSIKRFLYKKTPYNSTINNRWKIDLSRIVIVFMIALNISLYVEVSFKYILLLASDKLIDSSFSFTTWQIQASLAVLVIALFSIIQGRINEYYYGLSLKKALYLPKRNRFLSLNYWENTILILLTTVIPGFFIILKLHIGALLIEMWSFFLLLVVIKDSLEVFTQSDKYIAIVKSYTDELLRSPSEERKSEAKSQIISLGKAAESNLKETAYPSDNIQLNYLIDLIDPKSSCESPNDESNKLNDELQLQIFSTLNRIFESAIDQQATRYIAELVSKSARCKDKYMRQKFNILALRSYYEARLPFQYLMKLVNNYRYSQYRNIDVKDDLLYFLKYAVDRDDEPLFREIIKMLSQDIQITNNHSYAGFVLLIIVIYLYYYCYGEKLVRTEKAEKKTKLFELDIRDVGSKVSLRNIFVSQTRYIFPNVTDALTFFEEDSMIWEVMEEAEAKMLQIHTISVEFVSFYMYAIVPSYLLRKHLVDNFSLDNLIEIQRTISAVIKDADNNLSEKYKNFCKWMNVSYSIKHNMEVLSVLEDKLKEKLLQQELEARHQIETRFQKINEIQANIYQKSTISSLFGIPSPNNAYEIVDETYTLKVDYNSFSPHTSFSGVDDFIIRIIQHNLFVRSMRCFEKHEVIGEDTAQEDYDIFIKAIRSFQEKGIYVDTVFNTPIYDLHKYSDDIVSPETNDQIASIRDRIRSCGDWDISPSIASTIYLDSTVGIPRYFLLQTFINIDENPLAQDELIKYLDENKKGEDGLYYLSTLAPNLRYTLDEAIEFSRIYLFKITVSYQLYIPKNMLGFYTVYKSV